jgi:hypothetical protein
MNVFRPASIGWLVRRQLGLAHQNANAAKIVLPRAIRWK